MERVRVLSRHFEHGNTDQFYTSEMDETITFYTLKDRKEIAEYNKQDKTLYINEALKHHRAIKKIKERYNPEVTSSFFDIPMSWLGKGWN